MQGLIKLICDLRLSNLDLELNMFVAKAIEGAAEEIQHSNSIFRELLNYLNEAFQEKAIIIAGSPFRQLFHSVLSKYIQQYVEPEPEKGLSPSWTPIVCTSYRAKICKLCTDFNEYLQNFKETNLNYPNSQRNKDHMDLVLPSVVCPAGYSLLKKTSLKSKEFVERQKPATCHEYRKLRYDSAKKEIGSIGLDGLKEVLGDSYKSIVRLETVKRLPRHRINLRFNPGVAPIDLD